LRVLCACSAFSWSFLRCDVGLLCGIQKLLHLRLQLLELTPLFFQLSLLGSQRLTKLLHLFGANLRVVGLLGRGLKGAACLRGRNAKHES